MAKDNIKRFLCSCEWTKTLRKLPNDKRLKIYDAMFEYAETNVVPELDYIEDIVFEPIKDEICRYLNSYDAKRERVRIINERREAKKYHARTRMNANDNGQVVDDNGQVVDDNEKVVNDNGQVVDDNPPKSKSKSKSKSIFSNENNINLRNIYHVSMSKGETFDAESDEKDEKSKTEKSENVETDEIEKDSEEKKRKLAETKIAKEIATYYNDTVKAKKAKLRACVRLNDFRKGLIHSRIKEYGVDAVHEVIDKAVASYFLNYTATNAPVDIEWIMRPNNFPKILEGKYSNDRQHDAQKSNNSNHFDGENDKNAYVDEKKFWQNL